MAILQLKPHLTVEQLKERMQKEQKVHKFKRWQILHAVGTNKGITAQTLALLFACSVHVVKRTVQLYNKRGAAFLEQGKWGGRREKRCLMHVEQEEQLLQTWQATALEGGVLVAKQLRKAVEEKVGHSISDDYLWDLLRRHGWRKKAPRPEHSKAGEVKEKREAFKKKSLNSCRENALRKGP
jgi:transposase